MLLELQTRKPMRIVKDLERPPPPFNGGRNPL